MRRISLAVTIVAIALMGWFAGAQAPHGVSAQDATPAAGDDGMTGVTFAPLAISDVPALALPGTALVAKITIAPGGSFTGESTDPAFTLLYVESGSVIVNVDRDVTVSNAVELDAGTGTPVAVPAKTDVILEAGDSVGVPPMTGGILTNAGTEPVVMIFFNIMPGDGSDATPAP